LFNLNQNVKHQKSVKAVVKHQKPVKAVVKHQKPVKAVVKSEKTKTFCIAYLKCLILN